MPELSAQGSRRRLLRRRVVNTFRWLFCLYFVFLGKLVFRVRGWDDLIYCVKKYVLFDFDFRVGSFGMGSANPFLCIAMILVFIVFHGWSYRVGGLAGLLDRMGGVSRIAAYVAIILTLIVLWPAESTAFVYFQF